MEMPKSVLARSAILLVIWVGIFEVMDKIGAFDPNASSMATPIALLIIATILYAIPSIIAYRKAKKNRVAIYALNWLLGWTFIGWVAALVWALMND